MNDKKIKVVCTGHSANTDSDTALKKLESLSYGNIEQRYQDLRFVGDTKHIAIEWPLESNGLANTSEDYERGICRAWGFIEVIE